MKYLVLIFLFVSLLDAKIYRKNNIQVVIDDTNNFMWVDDISVLKIKKIHEDAITYCQNLSYAGYTNWRIPKLNEFETIVDKQNENDSAHDRSGRSGYKKMSDNFENSIAFSAACDLVFKGRVQPSGYTEPLLHKKRLEKKLLTNLQ